MDDVTPLLEEMRRINEEWHELKRIEAETVTKFDAIKARRQLLDETWKMMWSHDQMTLIQAKMIAHDNIQGKRQRQYFDWVEYGNSGKESRWLKTIRFLYLKLGGK